MKIKYLFLLVFLNIFVFFSCNNTDNQEDNSEARKLFTLSAELINNVTAQYESTKDSTEIDSLGKFYEKKINEINFSFPPQTDLKLNEQENDSLYFLLQKMITVRKKKLQEFSYKEAKDTVLI